MSDEKECPIVVLTSGQMLKLQKIMLYDENAVMLIGTLRAHAARGLGLGTGSAGAGLLAGGILGSHGLDYDPEAARVLLESDEPETAAQKTALQFLKRAQERYEALSRQGVFFDGADIINNDAPRPSAWSALGAPVERQVSINRLWKVEKDALLQKYNIAADDVEGGKFKITGRPRYVHNGDDFISVATDVGYMNLRWSQVTAYRPAQPPADDEQPSKPAAE